MDYNKDYGLEWYRYGLEKGDEPIMRFMMHWIAFNWLYSSFCKCVGEDLKEAAAIKIFCESNYTKLSKYDPFTTDAFQVFLENPVEDEHNGSTRIRRFEDLRHKTGLQRMIALFLTIYQVRCNLFHGSKSLRIERDVSLVRAASVILEGYLKAYWNI